MAKGKKLEKHKLQAEYEKYRDSFSGRRGKIGGGENEDGFSGGSGKFEKLTDNRVNNNRPASRNVIINWPEGGPKPIRRRGYEDSKEKSFSGRSGKF